MALPPVRKTWHFYHATMAAQANANVACQVLALALKNVLKGTGTWTDRAGATLGVAPTGAWTIVASSDSVTAGHDNVDRLDSSTDFVPLGSWYVARNTLLGLEYCFYYGDGGSNHYGAFLVVSRVGFGVAFGGTDGTTSNRPTAVDEWVPVNGGAWGGPTANTRSSIIAQISTDGITRVFLFRGSRCVSHWHFDRIAVPVSGLLYPKYAWFQCSSNDGAAGEDLLYPGFLWQGTDGLVAWRNDGTIFNPFSFYVSPLYDFQAPNIVVETDTTANELDGSWPMFPVNLRSVTSGYRGMVGFTEDVWWGLDALATGDCYDDGTLTERQFLHVDWLIIPWNGTNPTLNPGGAEPSKTIRLGYFVASQTDPAPDATAPTVTITPSAGAVDRFQAFQIDITDNLDLFRAVFVAVGFEGDLPSELVFVSAGAREGFCGRYSGQKEILSDGTIRLKSVRRLRGWPYPRAPKFYVWPIDTAGNLG
jgi:hypothetical protein